MQEENFKDCMRNIEVGWTEKQVRNLLGGPDKITPKKTGTTAWIYGQWPWTGTVIFNDGKVIGFKLPFFDGPPRW